MKQQAKPTEKRPLYGVRVLVGRARHQAGALSSELRKLGAQVIEIPFIEIRKPRSFRALDSALKNLEGYDWLIFTSVNGVEAMWERMRKLSVGSDSIDCLSIAAIGPATRKAIEAHGVKVNVVPKEYVAESVVHSLKNKVKGKRVLLVRAKVARDVIPRELRRAGADVDVVEAYETVVPRRSRRELLALMKNAERRPHVITFTSSSTVRSFAGLLGLQRASKTVAAICGRGRPRHMGLGGILMASIGPITSTTLREHGLTVDIAAKEFTIPGLVAAIVKKCTGARE
jgi:uroporphyrinogen-III synthase